MSYLAGKPDGVIAVIMQGPAALPPNGVTFAETESVNVVPQLLVLLGMTTSISTIALAIRLYTKGALIKCWNLEDLLLFFAWALLVFYSGEALIAVNNKIGWHMWNVKVNQYYIALEHVNRAAILYCVIEGLIKVAILLQYHRIFVPNRSHGGRRVLSYTIYGTMVSIIIFYIIVTFCAIWLCNPRPAFWDPYTKGTCLNWAALSQAVCIYTVVTDFALLIIPIFPVSKLHMARKKKIMICLLFAVGLLDCIASILRTYYTWTLTDSTDLSWNTAFMGMWATVEMTFGLVVASFPVSPKFYKFIKERYLVRVGCWTASSKAWLSKRGLSYNKNGGPKSLTEKEKTTLGRASKFSIQPDFSKLTQSDDSLVSEPAFPARVVHPTKVHGHSAPGRIYTGQVRDESRALKGRPSGIRIQRKATPSYPSVVSRAWS